MNGGQNALLRELALNLSVTGECWLVQQNPEPLTDNPYRNPDTESWNVFSIDELTFSPSAPAPGRPAAGDQPGPRRVRHLPGRRSRPRLLPAAGGRLRRPDLAPAPPVRRPSRTPRCAVCSSCAATCCC